MGEHFRDNEEKITLGLIVVGVTIIVVLMTALILYLSSTEDSNTSDRIVVGETNTIENKINNSSESTSTTIGKTVNEAANELKEEETSNSIMNKVSETIESLSTDTDSESNVVTESDTAKEEQEETTTKEVKFTAPIKGEILREFAPDSLVYSNTLEEWITHNGVDIKADKTSVVVAAAPGKVTAIKNDPRYGLTVIVDHGSGYQTVYANLLTAEFVVEGEDLEEGQTLGTVGNSATFEVSDDYHLHFELIRNSEYLNPNTYMEF